MFGLTRLSIQSKMILLLLAVSLSSIAVIAVIGYESGRSALMRSVESHLQGVRVAKTTTLKAMLEDLREHRLVIGERDEAVAHVARRRHPEVATQAPRRAAVIGQRHDRGRLRAGLLEAAQHGRQARAAAQADDARLSAHARPPAPEGAACAPSRARRTRRCCRPP